jgi:hypothetical protein
VVANINKRTAVNEQGSHTFHMERFNLKKLNEVVGKEKYRVEVWEMIRENIKTSAKESLGYYELKKHKPWFDEECSQLLDQRKQSKFKDPSEINEDNLSKVRCEASRHFRNQTSKYLKDKINE